MGVCTALRSETGYRIARLIRFGSAFSRTRNLPHSPCLKVGINSLAICRVEAVLTHSTAQPTNTACILLLQPHQAERTCC